MTYRLWGYANSWLVKGFNEDGELVYESRWFLSPKAAVDHAKELMA